MKNELIELVEGAARARRQPSIPRHFIEEALQRIDSGKEDIDRYPSGSPSLKDIYDIAMRIECASATKN